MSGGPSWWPEGSSSLFVTKGEGTLISAHRTPRANDGRRKRPPSDGPGGSRVRPLADTETAGQTSTANRPARDRCRRQSRSRPRNQGLDWRPELRTVSRATRKTSGLSRLRPGKKKKPDHNLWPGLARIPWTGFASKSGPQASEFRQERRVIKRIARVFNLTNSTPGT